MNEWCYFDSLQLTVMTLIFMICIVSLSNSICSSFYFYINSITKLSQALIFLSFLVFKKNAPREGTNSRGGEQSRRMNPREIPSQHMGSGLSHSDPSLDMQMWLVK